MEGVKDLNVKNLVSDIGTMIALIVALPIAPLFSQPRLECSDEIAKTPPKAFEYVVICDLGRYGRQSSGPDMLGEHRDAAARETVRRTWPYFSAENFARRITCETMVTVGFCDPTCAAHGGWSVCNLIKSPRKCIVGALLVDDFPVDLTV